MICFIIFGCISIIFDKIMYIFLTFSFAFLQNFIEDFIPILSAFPNVIIFFTEYLSHIFLYHEMHYHIFFHSQFHFVLFQLDFYNNQSKFYYKQV